jgi:hypothetical protein
LGEFGRSALQTRDIEQILQRAAELCAKASKPRSPKSLSICPTANGCWYVPASAGDQGRSAEFL